MRSTETASFYETITAAVADFAANGYDSTERLEYWIGQIRAAAERDLVPQEQLIKEVRQSLGVVFDRMVTNGGLLRRYPEVSRFTLERVKPQLRDALDRAILANVSLIKLQPDQAVAETLRRFAGWATSIPVGGSAVVAKNPVKSDIRKALVRTKYEARRLNNDQTHKFAASLSDILAKGGGAIAGEWEQHYTRYPREIHTDRKGKIYLVRNSWADEQSLVRPGPDGYMDQYEMPGELIGCRCSYRYIFGIRRLPDTMLTSKGKETLKALEQARIYPPAA